MPVSFRAVRLSFSVQSRGGVLVYILIAVGLMAALAFSLTRDGGGGGQAGRMDSARADLLAADIISHAGSAQQVVHAMTQWGATIDTLAFDLPGSTGYASDTGAQVYHPAGGGLSVFRTDNTDLFDASGTRGWVWQSAVNVGWSASADTDLLYSFLDLSPAICAAVNARLHGDSSIPESTADFDSVFRDTATNADLTATDCPACENVRAMCIRNGDDHVFYTIVSMR